MRSLIAVLCVLSSPAVVFAQDAAPTAPADAPALAKNATAATPSPYRFEIDGWLAGTAVLNATPTGPRYSGLGVIPGVRAAVVAPRHWALSLDILWTPLSVYEFSSGGTSGSIDYVGSLFVTASAGYDAQWGRFHLRPILGAGFLRALHTRTELPGEIYREENTFGLLLSPGLQIFVDVGRHFLLGAMLRFPVAFRVGRGQGFESEGNVDVAASYAFTAGVRFGRAN